MRYIAGVQAWADETAVATDTAPSNSVSFVDVGKSPNDATGVRVFYIAQWGDNPDGSSLTKWTFTAGEGWVSDEILVDTTRNNVITELKGVDGLVITSAVEGTDYTDMISYLSS